MISRIVSIVLGLVYIASGVGKLLDVPSFYIAIMPYGIPDDALPYIAIAIPSIEVILGFGLLFFVRTRLLALISIVLMTLFTVGFAYAHLAQGVDKCGCFGAISAFETTPVLSLVRDILLIAASVFLFRRPVTGMESSTPRWRLGFLCVIGAASFALSGMSMMQPLYSPEPYLNKRIQDTPMNAMVHTNSDSTYLIFAMSVTCSHCWNATENVKAYKITKHVDQIIGLSVGTDSAASVYKERFNPNFDIHLISNKEMKDITGGYFPKLFFVRRDSVVRILQWEIPSPWSLDEE